MPFKGPKSSLLCSLLPIVSQVNLVQTLIIQVFQMCLVAFCHMFLGVTSVLFLSSCQSKIFYIFFSSVSAAYLIHLILHTFMIHISFINSFVISFIPKFTSLAPVPY